MDLRATYAEDGVLLTDQLPAKAASPRPVTAADLIPGAGGSARPSPATVHGVAPPATVHGVAPPTTGGLRSSSSSTSVVGAGGVPYPSAGSSSMPPVSANASIILSSASSGPANPASKDPIACPDDAKFTPVEDDDVSPSRKIPFHRPRFGDPDEDGWSTANSRKFLMARGARPNEIVPEQTAVTCDLEVPWGVLFGGDLRRVKKWHQGRVTGTAMSKDDMGFRTYGTYGRDGFES